MNTIALRACALAALIALAVGGAARACPFHGYLPPLTTVDRLLDADRIVLARPGPSGAAGLVVTEVLRGEPGPAALEAAEAETRARLLDNPGHALLFARDPIDAEWRRLAYLDPPFREAMEAVLAAAPGWAHPEAPERFRMSAEWLDHPDPRLRELALRELDRAPYALLRRLDVRLDPSDTVGEGDPALEPIRALLLGVSDHPRAAEAVHAGLTRAGYGPGWSTPLGAYAVALVEIEGADALDRLERDFLADPKAGPDQLGPVIEALAIHRPLGAAPLVARIDSALARLLEARPDAAVLVARRFGSREDWSQGAALQGLLNAGRVASAASLIAVSGYVALARNAADGADRPVD